MHPTVGVYLCSHYHLFCSQARVYSHGQVVPVHSVTAREHSQHTYDAFTADITTACKDALGLG